MRSRARFGPTMGQVRQLFFRGRVEIDDPVFMVSLAMRTRLLLPRVVVLELGHATLLSSRQNSSRAGEFTATAVPMGRQKGRDVRSSLAAHNNPPLPSPSCACTAIYSARDNPGPHPALIRCTTETPTPHARAVARMPLPAGSAREGFAHHDTCGAPVLPLDPLFNGRSARASWLFLGVGGGVPRLFARIFASMYAGASRDGCRATVLATLLLHALLS